MKISAVRLHIVAIKAFNHSVHSSKKLKQTQVQDDFLCFQKMYVVREHMFYWVF